MGRLLAAAKRGDEGLCGPLLEQARALHLSDESVLVGLLQPALYQAGIEWRDGALSVAVEHRLTSWCERAFHLLAAPPPPQTPLDLLILQAPGNVHTVGPRFAARALAARGLSVAVSVPELPFDEIVEECRRLRPRRVGFSCALPGQIAPALALIGRLRAILEPALAGGYLLSGFAFRQAPEAAPPTLPDGVRVVVDFADVGV